MNSVEITRDVLIGGDGTAGDEPGMRKARPHQAPEGQGLRTLVAPEAYARAPMMIYWELTRSCDLSCRHCRAEAVPWRHPRELTTAQGYRLLEELAGFIDRPSIGAPPGHPGSAARRPDPERPGAGAHGSHGPRAGHPGGGVPHLVLTGGDPLKRPDVYELAAYGISLGLQVSITPAGTPALTQEALVRLRACGIATVALSLDGSTPDRHDRIRQVDGSFARTIQGARWVRELGLGLQINSLLCAETADDMPALYRLACELDADRWSVFFLVTVGRGQLLGQVEPEECERLLHWFYDLAQQSPRPIVKTTEAHHFRRVALERQKAAGKSGGEGASAIRRGFGIRDGAGIMFISHTGDVYPSGFLPIPVGNVLGENPVALYRDAGLFRQLRDPELLKGKCGACEYRAVCGGARSRAWAASGDPLAEDPLCLYLPASLRREDKVATAALTDRVLAVVH